VNQVEINSELEKLLLEEKIAWLTTMRGDGTPLPAPIWFLWRDSSFLIYSLPKAKRVSHIANNPRVAINLNTDPWGDRVVVVTGMASVDPGARPVNQVPAYIEKYSEAMKQIDTTPESMAKEYSTAIHVKPIWIRYE
jgi:PPOX class probable F420-dependent enzyme